MKLRGVGQQKTGLAASLLALYVSVCPVHDDDARRDEYDGLCKFISKEVESARESRVRRQR